MKRNNSLRDLSGQRYITTQNIYDNSKIDNRDEL